MSERQPPPQEGEHQPTRQGANSYGTDDRAEQVRIEAARQAASAERRRNRERLARLVDAGLNPEDAQAVIEFEDAEQQRRDATTEANEVEPPSRPRVYIRSLVDYNEGHLIGDWVDANQHLDGLEEDVQAILARSLHAHWTGEPSEEWAIHDYEGFGGVQLHEHESLDVVATLGQGVAEHGLAYAAWAEINDARDTATLAQFREAYLGAFDSREAWAMEVTEQTGLIRILAEAVPEQWVQFVQIDFEAIVHEMETSGSVRFADHPGGVWVFDGRV